MDYISSKELAKQWGVTTARIVRLAADGRIPGAVLVGKSWIFPRNAEKPADGRRREAKENARFGDYHFPLYFIRGYSEEELAAFSPEEKLLVQAGKLVQYGEYGEARALLEKMLETCTNIYIRIGCLHLLGYVYLSFPEEHERLNECRLALYMLFEEDFPHKEELVFILRETECTFQGNEYFLNTFSIPRGIEISNDANVFLMVLSGFAALLRYYSATADFPTEVFELACRRFAAQKYWYPEMLLHCYLSVVYLLENREKKSTYHLKAMLEVGITNKYYAVLAEISMYCPDQMNDMLKEYPKKLQERIHALRAAMQENYAKYLENTGRDQRFNGLTQTDYTMIYYALRGYSVEQVAEQEKIAPVTVQQRYSRLYRKTGLPGKKKLVNAYMAAVSDLYGGNRPEDTTEKDAV